MREAPLKPFCVKLKRVIYAEVVIYASSAADARKQIEAEGPHEWFVEVGDSFHGDETTIVSVKKDKAT